MIRSKKAQISIGDAPTVVMVVGLVFLLLATFAYINVKSGDSFSTETTTLKNNDSVGPITDIRATSLSVAGLRNVACDTATVVVNASGEAIASGNYTQSGCTITATTKIHYSPGYNNSKWNITYSYTHDLESIASNITNDSSTEIAGNTSIAGIVLTISLIGIVLTLLIGIFLAARRGGM